MNKAVKVLQRIETLAGAILLSIFLVSVLIQMFSRYLGISVTWTGEVCTYSFIMSVYFGAGSMVLDRRHFAFTALGDKLKTERAKRIHAAIISCVMLLFNVVMCYYGVLIAKQYWNYTWTTLPKMKKGPVFLVIPISATLSVIFLAALILEDLKAAKSGEFKPREGGEA